MLDFKTYPKFVHYLLYGFLFILGQTAAMWGLFSTLPYKNLTMWQAYKMAIPFVWIEWIIMTYAISFQDNYNLFTPTNIILLLMITQFTTVLVINKYYFKNNTYMC